MTLPQNFTISTLDKNKRSRLQVIKENIKKGNFKKYFKTCLADFEKKLSGN